MKRVHIWLVVLSVVLLAACNNDTHGVSTPIDSTNVKGAPPAAYEKNNPARDQSDSNRTNVNDTGTKANNVHNTGY